MKTNYGMKTVKTACGTFQIAATEKGLYALSFPHKKKQTAVLASSPLIAKNLSLGAKWLRNYFSGKTQSLTGVKIDWSGHTEFQEKVLRMLAKVPCGKKLSYRELAEKSGYRGASRAVGSVMSRNRLPIVLPCHRVLASNGGLGGYSLGLSWKKRLLALETGTKTSD